MRRGCFIKLRAFGGKHIVRRFVRRKNGSVLICSDEEYRLAIREGRQPLCVGFPLSEVLDEGADARKANHLPRRGAAPAKRPAGK